MLSVSASSRQTTKRSGEGGGDLEGSRRGTNGKLLPKSDSMRRGRIEEEDEA